MVCIVDPAIFSFLYKVGKFSIVDTYLELAADYKVSGFEHNPGNWVDMGKPEELVKAEKILKRLKSKK